MTHQQAPYPSLKKQGIGSQWPDNGTIAQEQHDWKPNSRRFQALNNQDSAWLTRLGTPVVLGGAGLAIAGQRILVGYAVNPALMLGIFDREGLWSKACLSESLLEVDFALRVPLYGFLQETRGWFPAKLSVIDRHPRQKSLFTRVILVVWLWWLMNEPIDRRQ